MSIINNLNFSFTKKPESCYRKRPITGWKLWTLLMGLTTVTIIGVLFYFIYNNIYLTIANANTVYFLQANNEVNNVDMAAYQKAKDRLKIKTNTPPPPKNLRNIFSYQNTVFYESTSTNHN